MKKPKEEPMIKGVIVKSGCTYVVNNMELANRTGVDIQVTVHEMEEVKPYIDCEVDETLLYRYPRKDTGGAITYRLSVAVDNPKFIGYVYADGGLLGSPRFYENETKPAQIPTHVRFAK